MSQWAGSSISAPQGKGESVLDTAAHFQEWLTAVLSALPSQEWISALTAIAIDAGEEAEEARHIELEDAILQAVQGLLLQQQWHSAQRLYTCALEARAISPEKVVALLMAQARNATARQDRSQEAILYQQVFELQPDHTQASLQLTRLAAEANNAFQTSIYAAVATENLICDQVCVPLRLLTVLFNGGHYEAFFQLAETVILTSCADEQRTIAGLLSLLAEHYSLDYVDHYHERWSVEDLISKSITGQFLGNIFDEPLSAVYAVLGEAFERLASRSDVTAIGKLALRGEATSFYMYAAMDEEVGRLLNAIFKEWTLEKLDELYQISTYDPSISVVSWVLLFRCCYQFCYVSDDLVTLRLNQNISAKLFSRLTQLYYPDLCRNYDFNLSYEPQRRLRIGYLASTFRRHSVGILCSQVFRHHDHSRFETYCYLIDCNSSQLSEDPIHQIFYHSSDHFRDLTSKTVPEIVEVIRQDNLDIIIYLDSLTINLGNEVLALRVAPVQVSWLGGDSTGLPEIDYFFVDPYLLDESAQQYYPEELIRLPSFIAVDQFDVKAIDLKRFRNYLNIPQDAFIYWTSCFSTKRNSECIQAQLEILRQVPNSILVVRGLGDLATVVSIYKRYAAIKGVSERIRFLSYAQTSEQHRAEMQLADLLLDTFPYTGATQTVEALWVGLPVLTKVGRHYYGRMSFSLLNQVGLQDCITFSVEDYIKQGIAFANNPSLLQAVNQNLRDSKRWSILWDPRELCRFMESTLQALVTHKSHAELNHSLQEILSATEWNLRGLEHLRILSSLETAQDRQKTWELAMSCWRSGLKVDSHHFLCWMNRIYGFWVLGHTNKALNAALQLWKLLILSPDLFQSSSSKESVDSLAHLSLAWKLPYLADNHSKLTHEISSDSGWQGSAKIYLHYLSRWIADHIGVVYRPEAFRFWNFASELNPDDSLASLVVAMNKVNAGDIEGLLTLRELTAANQHDHRYQLAEMVAEASIHEAYDEPTLEALVSIDYCDYRLNLEPKLDSVVTFVLLTQGKWFEADIGFCQEVIEPGMNVIDVGANVGVYTFLFAKQVGSSGRVYAYEPTPSCAKLLKKSVKDNNLDRTVLVKDVAVGDKYGSAQLVLESASVFNYIKLDTGESSDHESEKSNVLDNLNTISVTQVTLDQEWEDLDHPIIHFLKIDAEGAEKRILNGASEMINHCRPVILFENVHSGLSSGKGCIDYLFEYGYHFFNYYAELNALTELKSNITQSLNVICIPNTNTGLQYLYLR